MSSPPVCASYANGDLTSFTQLEKGANYLSVDVSDNPISDFVGIEFHKTLAAIKANNTQISSLAGAVPIETLENINMIGCPLANEKYCLQMIVIALAPNLRVFNGKTINEKVKKQALQLKPLVHHYLVNGYVIISMEPLTVSLHGSSDAVIIDLSVEEYQRQREAIEENEKTIIELQRRIDDLTQMSKESKTKKPTETPN